MEFDNGKQSLVVGVNGPLVLDDLNLMTRAALDGVGLAFMMEGYAAPYLASGALIRVLEDWCQPFAGDLFYYPSRWQQPPALSAPARCSETRLPARPKSSPRPSQHRHDCWRGSRLDAPDGLEAVTQV